MVRLGTTVRIQIFVRHDMESVELHGKVDNIGKVGEMTSLGIILMLHISLKGIFFSSSMGDSYYHLPLGVNVK